MLLNEEILPHYQNSQFFLNFRYFEHTLILTKCLVPCMFTLTEVYYINLILIILPLSCSPLKIFLRSSKLWSIRNINAWFNMVFLEIPQNSQEKICARVSLKSLSRVRLRPAILLKRRLWHRCFPVNFVKFLRKTFLTEHLRRLLLLFLTFLSSKRQNK